MCSNDKKENPLDDERLKKRMTENLKKTFDLIELHQGLKLALYKKLYPTKNESELLYLMSMTNLKRKETSWKPQTN